MKALRDKEAGALQLPPQDHRENTDKGLTPVAPASSPYHNEAEIRALMEAHKTIHRLTNQSLRGIRPETWELIEVRRLLKGLVNGRIDCNPIWGGGC